MIWAIIGLPFSGRRTLARLMAESWPGTATVSHHEVRSRIEGRSSETAREANRIVSRGELISAELLGRILFERCEGRSEVVLTGCPKTVAELLALERLLGTEVYIVLLNATDELIRQRARAHGTDLQSHREDRLRDLRSTLGEIASVAASRGKLLELDANVDMKTHLAKIQAIRSLA